MNPLIELDALEAAIKPVIPGASIHLLKLPEKPVSNMLAIRYLGEDAELSGQGYAYNVRRWQVLFFHKQLSQAMTATENIKHTLTRSFKIPFNHEGATRYVTIRSFSPGQPNENESGLNYTLSVLETATHGDIETEVYQKMREIFTTITD